MSIDRLIQEERGYAPRLLPVVDNQDNLFAIIGMMFELVVELCVNDGNEYQHRFKQNSQKHEERGIYERNTYCQTNIYYTSGMTKGDIPSSKFLSARDLKKLIKK